MGKRVKECSYDGQVKRRIEEAPWTERANENTKRNETENFEKELFLKPKKTTEIYFALKMCPFFNEIKHIQKIKRN